MTDAQEREYWRVGYHTDPTGFVPKELCAWNHRFDDPGRRFRTIYIAELDETAIREVLADLRPNTAAIARYIEKFGPRAAKDVPAQPVTESWRRQHVLAKVRPVLNAPVLDLCDADVRYKVEREHTTLLNAHGMDHLDLSEITAKRRPVTQTIAAYSYDDLDAAGVRFPSSLDGNVCVALFEGRAALKIIGDPVALIDPAPRALRKVCMGWHLEMERASGP